MENRPRWLYDNYDRNLKNASLGVSSYEMFYTADLCCVPLVIFKVLMSQIDDILEGCEL